MRRLAWFSPLPPTRSGIATYSAEILPLLRTTCEIDTYDQTTAHDFVWRQRRHPYDLTIYQLGNSRVHDFMWPYLFRHPGLNVLHDAQLHQARAGALLDGQRHPDAYRAEFRYNHPDAPPEVAEFIIDRFGGVLYHFWPMLRLPVASARAVAVHSRRLADDLRAEFPGAAIEHVRMGVADPAPSIEPAALRARLGLAPETLILAAYGGVTPEKRIGPVLRAIRAIAEEPSNLHLLLVGEQASYYDALAEARTLGLESQVTLTGFVSDEDLPSYIEVADVCMCLRWPTSRETSASWLRCLARGKTTVINDLTHTCEIPVLDPRNWSVLSGDPTAATAADEPIAVSIDILDEDHSLRLALRRLTVDQALRRQLGAAARKYWAAGHSLDNMAADYRGVIERTCERPTPTLPDPPAHLFSDQTALARRIVSEMGTSVDFL